MFLTGSNRTTTPLVSQLNIAVEKDLPVASRFSLLKMTKELLSRWFDQLRMLSFTGLLRKVPKMCDSRLINVGIRCALAFTSLILLFFAVRNISRILDVERSDAVVVKAEIRNNVTVKLPEPTMCLQVSITIGLFIVTLIGFIRSRKRF